MEYNEKQLKSLSWSEEGKKKFKAIDRVLKRHKDLFDAFFPSSKEERSDKRPKSLSSEKKVLWKVASSLWDEEGSVNIDDLVCIDMSAWNSVVDGINLARN